MRIAVVIATAGRPDIIRHPIAHELGQTRAPDRLLAAGSEERDFLIERPADATVEWVVGPGGSTFQRNLGLAMVEADADPIVFFDNDFLPQPDGLQQAESALIANPDGLAFTGHAPPQIARSLAANVVKPPKPKPYDDRRRRLEGNLLALIGPCRGRADPERVARI
ncbi:MAG: glycosyltransferase family 2 protein [Methylocystis sp.]|nr:glycosyltransferase family 2 protein [Methylocystis sp.]MCA3584600.1 glycosyltransferase family 2 protein [Methylocystis sp.]MCA3589020.1 glycosyltransferase family 2 protein [Methylocystis sp.]MCA3593109.1 glycosyltransferase family 2 protein [Methylocystis sp.]